VEIVDAELIEDTEYLSMGKTPGDRVKTLLGKLHSVTSSQIRGSKVSKRAELMFNKFVKQVEDIFKNLPKPLEWRSFYNNDLPLLMDFCEELHEVSIQYYPWPCQVGNRKGEFLPLDGRLQQLNSLYESIEVTPG